MRSIVPTTVAAVALVLAAACCNQEHDMIQEFVPIPDAAYAKGVSAPFCGVIGDVTLVAGGANFPEKSLLEGGAKKVYRDIWANDGAAWHHAGLLPDSTAYGATFAVEGTLIFAGGNVNGQTTDRVYEVSLGEDCQAVVKPLPALPVPMEQAGWTSDGECLYLVGGAGTKGVFACKIGEYIWSQVAELPEPLVQPVAFAAGGKLYVWGGFNPETLEVSPRGICLQDGQWTEAPGIPDGGTFVGATGVTLPDGRLVAVGGVNREIFSRALHNTPEDRIPYLSKEPAEYRFRSEVWAFDPADESWALLCDEPACALAGPGVAALPDGSIVVAGGELKPGVRSPRIFTLKF